MALFVKGNNGLENLQAYNFKDEDELQELLYTYHEMVFDIPELELANAEIAIKFRELSTSSGSIDILYITNDADIILVETKLIKNPEFKREVLAQIVDYIKALTIEGYERILETKKCKSFYINPELSIDDRFKSLLRKNIDRGNINGVIIGDDIHPNLLGMVEAIQSAPHLAFHINLVKIDAFKFNNNIIVSALNVENTKEIERAVINITFNEKQDKPIIESSTPSKEGKGTKPILTWENYINSINDNYKDIVIKSKNDWQNYVDDSLNMGSTGFSLGVLIEGKRIPMQLILDTYLYLISEKTKQLYNIPDEIYLNYKNEIKKAPSIYDKHLISNKPGVNFTEMDDETFSIVINAAIKCAKEWKEKYKENK
jgi:hypothetical protein